MSEEDRRHSSLFGSLTMHNIGPLRTKIYFIGSLIYTATANEDILHQQTKYIFIFNGVGLANLKDIQILNFRMKWNAFFLK
ncbi:hypothetical protein B5F71_12795 [Bacteroides sp. An269]|nr:hypothetical protein B5F71_12795 [Bacteroides sp. An269]